MFLRELFETDPTATAALREAVHISFARRGTRIVRSYHREPGEVDGENRRGITPKRRFVAKRVKAVTADRVAGETAARKPVRTGSGGSDNPLSLRVQRTNHAKGSA
jgi:hypothetical protein